MENKFTRYIAAGASALAAFFIAVISFLSSRLKSEKKKAADNAAKAKSYETQMEKLESVHPDFLEVLPGVMPKTIRKICAAVHTPVLAGGLISDKEDVMAALRAGAMAISTTNQQVWMM